MKMKKSVIIASSGYLVFAAVALYGMTHPDPNIASKAPIFVLISVGLGFLTFKFPFITTALGSVFFGPQVFFYIFDSLRNGVVSQNPLGFSVASLIVGYIAFAMFLGLVPQIRLRLKKTRQADNGQAVVSS